MLVLTRKLMEKLFIGDNICVTVVRLEGGQVRLGIEAPREVAVIRAELVPERNRQAMRARAGYQHPEQASGCRVRHSPASARETDNRRHGRFR